MYNNGFTVMMNGSRIWTQKHGSITKAKRDRGNTGMKALFTLYANPIQFLIKSFLCTVISLDFNAHMDVVWIVFWYSKSINFGWIFATCLNKAKNRMSKIKSM